MRFAPAIAHVLVAVVLAAASAPARGENECTTVVLHAVPGLDVDCQTTLDCASVPPTIRIDNPAGMYSVVVYLKNYDRVMGVQVAYDWPTTWSYGFALWMCQPGQLGPGQPTGPGPISGTVSVAFNAISGGELAPIGMLIFYSIEARGCLSIIESAYPFGNHVINDDGGVTPLLDINEGRVCVGSEGWNTCDCRVTSTETSTWGQIKATYGR